MRWVFVGAIARESMPPAGQVHMLFAAKCGKRLLLHIAKKMREPPATFSHSNTSHSVATVKTCFAAAMLLPSSDVANGARYSVSCDDSSRTLCTASGECTDTC